jgi:malonate transporter and related proteins
MVDILNLALTYFGLIFVGFACGKAKSLPESGLAWTNFFLLYVHCLHCFSSSCQRRRLPS